MTRMPTFSEFTVSWLSTWAVVKLKASAYREYESLIRIHLVPSIGELPLDEVTAERIQAYVAAKVAAGYSSRSVNNHVIVLRRVLQTAVEWGLLLENPVDMVARPRIERSEMSYLTPDELSRLIDATPASWRLLLALPAFGGLRKGECLALEWTDFGFDPLRVSITKSVRNKVVSTPKTRNSIATVVLPESLSSYIAQRRRQASGNKLVFCRHDGSPLPDSFPNKLLQRSLNAAGLSSIRFHDLRHSWAVAHIRAGTDIKTLAALGRWSSTTTLLETYAHVMPSMGGDAVARFDDLFTTD